MKIDKEAFFATLVKIIGEHTGAAPDGIVPEDNLRLLGIDSIDMAEITFELELELDCEFIVPYKAETVGEFAEALVKK